MSIQQVLKSLSDGQGLKLFKNTNRTIKLSVSICIGRPVKIYSKKSMICRCEINNQTSIFDNYSLILRILSESTLNLQVLNASTVNVVDFLSHGV